MFSQIHLLFAFKWIPIKCLQSNTAAYGIGLKLRGGRSSLFTSPGNHLNQEQTFFHHHQLVNLLSFRTKQTWTCHNVTLSVKKGNAPIWKNCQIFWMESNPWPKIAKLWGAEVTRQPSEFFLLSPRRQSNKSKTGLLWSLAFHWRLLKRWTNRSGDLSAELI